MATNIPTNNIGQMQVRDLPPNFPGQVTGQNRMDAEDALPNKGTRTAQVTTIAIPTGVTAFDLLLKFPATQYEFPLKITGLDVGNTPTENATAVKAILEGVPEFGAFFEFASSTVVTLTARQAGYAADVSKTAETGGTVTVTDATSPTEGSKVYFGAPVFLQMVSGKPVASSQPSTLDAPTAIAELCGIAKRVRHLETDEDEHLGSFADDDMVIFMRFASIGVKQTDSDTVPDFGGTVWMGYGARAGEFLTANDGGGSLAEVTNGKLKWKAVSEVEVNCAV